MRKFLLPSVLLLCAFFGMLTALDGFPPFAWDEGWTVTVARNWVERGFYGMSLDGQPRSAGLAAAFPSVVAVALAFQTFGIGLWQSRFVSVCFMLGAFAAQYALTRRLYGARVASLSVLILFFIAPHFDMHALYNGRVVLAEPLMLFFLVMGFLFFARGLEKNYVALIGAAVIWSLGLNAKAQPLPFWFAALAAIFLYALTQRQWRAAVFTVGTVSASILLMRGELIAFTWLLGAQRIPGAPVAGLLNVTALVFESSARADALLTLVLTALPFCFGLMYASYRWARPAETTSFVTRALQLGVLLFVWSWTLWYVTLSIGWARYLFPAAFVGSMFPALLLERAARTLSFQSSAHAKFLPRFALAISVAILFALYLIFTFWQLVPNIRPDTSAQQATAWLNANVPASALVETYESEILFALRPRAHYPPDALNVEIIRKRQLDPTIQLSYDPRAINADYVVIGRFGRAFFVYDQLLAGQSFTRVAEIGFYTIYQRSGK